MSHIIDLRAARAARTADSPQPLDVLVTRLAREHDSHESGVLPCYLCLHGVARSPDVLAKAA